MLVRESSNIELKNIHTTEHDVALTKRKGQFSVSDKKPSPRCM